MNENFRKIGVFEACFLLYINSNFAHFKRTLNTFVQYNPLVIYSLLVVIALCVCQHNSIQETQSNINL